jgi:hypothetical protein
MALPVAACARHHQRRQRRASPRRSFVPAAVPIQPWLCPICSRMNGANLIPVGSVAKSCGCWPGPEGAGLVLRVLAWSCGCWPGPAGAGLVLRVLAWSCGCEEVAGTTVRVLPPTRELRIGLAKTCSEMGCKERECSFGEVGRA